MLFQIFEKQRENSVLEGKGRAAQEILGTKFWGNINDLTPPSRVACSFMRNTAFEYAWK